MVIAINMWATITDNRLRQSWLCKRCRMTEVSHRTDEEYPENMKPEIWQHTERIEKGERPDRCDRETRNKNQIERRCKGEYLIHLGVILCSRLDKNRWEPAEEKVNFTKNIERIRFVWKMYLEIETEFLKSLLPTRTLHSDDLCPWDQALNFFHVRPGPEMFWGS